MFTLAKNRKRLRVAGLPDASCYAPFYPLDENVFLVAFNTLTPATYGMEPVWSRGPARSRSAFTVYKVHHPKDDSIIDAYVLDFGNLTLLRQSELALCYGVQSKASLNSLNLNGVAPDFVPTRETEYVSLSLANGATLILLDQAPVYAAITRLARSK